MSFPKHLALAAVLAGTALAGTACAAETPANPQAGAAGRKIPAEDKQAVADANNEFALDLYARLRGKEGNLFFSPFSISTALAMTYAGARGNTAEQMADVLHFTLEQQRLHPAAAELIESLQANKESDGYELCVANALWGQQDYAFLDGFINLTQTHYRAGLNKVDFRRNTESVRQTINAWVEKETREKIKDLIKPGMLDAMTRLVLTNAIYFKGDWAVQFDPKTTRNLPFILLDGNKTNAQMMHHTGDYRYLETAKFQAIEIPYKNKEVSMIIFLPKTHDGLPAFEESLTGGNLSEWLGKMRSRKIDTLALPKFTMTCEFQLGEMLASMGMTDAFSGTADFSGMTASRDLFISEVVHKAFVEVNEEGTEAAAATGVVMKLNGMRKPTIFRADHPFLFLIRDTATGSVLFMGRVMQPE